MASRTIHDKIPHNVRVNKTAVDEAMLRAMYRSAARRSTAGDAVAPSVKGVQGVQPSVRGIAAKARDARYARLAQVAKVAADGLHAIQTIKDSAEAATNPELAALTNDPAFMAVISKVVEKIGNEVNGLTKPLTSVRMHSEERALRAKEMVTGMADSRPILTAEDMARVERARAKLSRLKTAEALGDAGDIVRARFGLEPRAYDSDAMHSLMDRLEGKTK
jgi:metal-dependent amidase/aminoacylase/carboxypeptidase family protein